MIIITDSAFDQIARICQQNGKPVRFTIEAGGCQGFNKVWDLDDSTTDDDVTFQENGGTLVIDKITIETLGPGATIDFKTDLGGSYFTVEVPTASSTCGCGTSFSI